MTKKGIKMEGKETENEFNDDVKESLRLMEDLKFFLATAPANWQENQVIRRYYLNHDEGFVSCIFWNNLYFITGTDIVRCIVYKLQHFGRRIVDRKKFEEGIFSDLRNLKCGVDAVLEPPKSEFLDFLFKNSCLRTQKKQKVFFWFNVPHDKLMADALERDLKKEKLGQNPTTVAEREPALSFKYDESKFLFNQLTEHMDLQKSLTKTPVESAASVESNSPEYLSSSHFQQAKEGAMAPEASDVYKGQSDYEDDFPLDYFNQEESFYNRPNDYITLDMNLGPLVGEPIDQLEYLEPVQYTMTSPTANELVHNEEYLIEQTQPIKTPLVPLSTTSYQPKSAKFSGQRIASATEEHFPYPYQQPPSAKYQSFPAKSGLLYNDPLITKQPALAGIFHPEYNCIHEDSEFWSPVPVYEQVGHYYNQPSSYMVLDEYFMPQSNPYQAMNPAMMSTLPQRHSPSSNQMGFSASSRQQAISANMMRKKSQLKQQNQQKDSRVRFGSYGVSKPTTIRVSNADQSLDEIVTSKSTRIVNMKDNQEKLLSNDNDNLIPTPESSITHTEQANNSN